MVDELHMVGDSQRGFLIEPLLTKVSFFTQINEENPIQIIGMSATLPNLPVLAR